VKSSRLVLHSINNFLISQSNLLALPQKGSFRKLPLFKGDKKQHHSFKHHHALDLSKKKLSDKNENVAHPKKIIVISEN